MILENYKLDLKFKCQNIWEVSKIGLNTSQHSQNRFINKQSKFEPS